MFSLLGSILRSFLRKTSSQTSKSLSFPKASIGNPDEIVTLRSTQGHGEYSRTMTGPPIKTFGGDHPEINSHECFLDSPSACHKAVKPQSSRSDSRIGAKGMRRLELWNGGIRTTGLLEYLEYWSDGMLGTASNHRPAIPCVTLFQHSNSSMIPSLHCSNIPAV